MKPTQIQMDIISALIQQTCAIHVLERIWSHLDWKTLKNATLVCHTWLDGLQNESFWQDLIFKNACCDKSWRQMTQEMLDTFRANDNVLGILPGDEDGNANEKGEKERKEEEEEKEEGEEGEVNHSNDENKRTFGKNRTGSLADQIFK